MDASSDGILVNYEDKDDDSIFPITMEVCQGMDCDGMVNTLSPEFLRLKRKNKSSIITVHGNKSDDSIHKNCHSMKNRKIKVEKSTADNYDDDHDFVHIGNEANDSQCMSIEYDCVEDQPYRTTPDENGVSKLCVFSYPPDPFVMENSHCNNNGDFAIIDALLPGQKVTALQSCVLIIDSNKRKASSSASFNSVREQTMLEIRGCSRLSVWDTSRAVFLFIRYSNMLENDGVEKEGYVCYSLDSYAFLRRTSPNLTRRDWFWRVTYTSGALVRSGVELSSEQIDVIPFGSFVLVLGRVINEMGLARLHVRVHNDFIKQQIDQTEENKLRFTVGYVSEKLNPLSGQSGYILKPLPFSFPLTYRVIIPEGAVMRDGKELSSKEVGKINFGECIRIYSMEYSEHPANKCIERLKILDNDCFVSLKLNKQPPQDVFVCELIDESTDYEFYINMPERIDESLNDGAIGSHESLPSSRVTSIFDKYDECYHKTMNYDKKCVICLLEDRTSTIVHGETGHIACCLECARVLKARGDRCPVCRLEIEQVIQHFWA